MLAFKKCFAECTEEMEKNDDTTDLSQDETCKERFDKSRKSICFDVVEKRIEPYNCSANLVNRKNARKALR